MVADKALLGYVEPWSIEPGQQISCKISANGAVRNQLVRLTGGGPRPSQRESALRYDAIDADCNGTYSVTDQPNLPGSYAIATCDDRIDAPESISFLAWVMPTLAEVDELQGILSLVDDDGDASLGMGIAPGGAAAVFVGGGSGEPPQVVTTEHRLTPHRWHLVGASVDRRTGGVGLFVMPAKTYPLGQVASAAHEQLHSDRHALHAHRILIGARALGDLKTGDDSRHQALGCFDGKIDAPRILGAELTAEDLRFILEQEELPARHSQHVLAQWDFSIGPGTTFLSDTSGNGWHGTTYNSPLRAVTGHNWTGRYLDWRSAPHEYGAVYFHSDDLDDAAWKTAFTFAAPVGLPSGVYAMRLESDDDGLVLPFFVRPPLETPSADVCVLMPTFSYMAYSNFESGAVDAEAMTGAAVVRDPVDEVINDHPEYGWSLYNVHRDGSGIAYVSRRRPMLDMHPEHKFWLSGGGGWALSSDMYLIDWLMQREIAFDVLTDEDVHAAGTPALSRYRVVITGSHPEYTSASMLGAFDEFIDGGGRLMYLGGNGFYWVTEPLPDRGHVIEIRRGQAGTRTWEGAPGEGHLSANGDPGGLWRHRGKPPPALVGVGFAAQGGGGSASYVQTEQRSDPRVAFMFDGVKPDEEIGDFGHNMGGAAGDEIDRADAVLGTPPHALVVATSSGRHNDFYQHVVEEVPVMFPGQGGTTCPDVRADMTYFETNGGGAVFTSASIDWSASLSWNNYDNNVSRITENVLQHFRRP